MYVFLLQFQIQHLKEEAHRKTEEMKTLQKVLEENDVERKRLAQLVRDQESQLQQTPDPRTMDEHQLQRYLDMICDIMDSKKKLLDAEDEHHITATEVKILQEEVICSQKHATTLVSGCRNGHYNIHNIIRSHLLPLTFHSPSFYIPFLPTHILFLSCLHAHPSSMILLLHLLLPVPSDAFLSRGVGDAISL